MKNFAPLFLLTFLLLAGCSDDTGLDLGDSENGSESVSQGSYSRLLVRGTLLYGINENFLTTVDISDENNPQVLDKQELQFDTESLFFYENVLYIGSRSRMYIYVVDAEGIPRFASESRHILERIESDPLFPILVFDPIVANESTAYVTLNSLNSVAGRVGINEMRIYDISDLQNPTRENTLQMSQPKGLTLLDDYLFVCDGFNGLVVFDVSDSFDPVEIHHFPGYDAQDVIVRDDILLVVAHDVLYQYDISEMSSMSLLSTINL